MGLTFRENNKKKGAWGGEGPKLKLKLSELQERDTKRSQFKHKTETKRTDFSSLPTESKLQMFTQLVPGSCATYSRGGLPSRGGSREGIQTGTGAVAVAGTGCGSWRW